jgi:hypothetical protein
MNELKLKMPIKIEPSNADKGYVITDANNTEYFFYEEDGELVYDGCCVEPKRIDIIEEHLEFSENNPLKSLTKKRKLSKN